MKRFVWLSILAILCFCSVLRAEDKKNEKINVLTPGAEQLESLLEKAGLNYEVDEDGYYFVVFDFEDNRSQRVLIEIIDEEGKKGYVLSSGVALIYEKQIDKSILIKLLQDNADIWFGGYCIFENLLILKIFITDEMIQGDIESFLGAVAVCADEMERQFTDEDMY